ncbi:MAG: hypothetical protein FWB99_12495, partial [Treponema sp.]|nr:hypothetical protein [Treponema sp.]
MSDTAFQPITIAPEKKLLVPPVYAALGMAASYYGYPFFVSASAWLLFAVLLFFVLVLSFLRTLRFHTPAAVHAAAILVAAVAAGFSLGIAARASAPGPV